MTLRPPRIKWAGWTACSLRFAATCAGDRRLRGLDRQLDPAYHRRRHAMTSLDGRRRVSPWAYIGIAAATVGVAAVILLAMGRTPWCRCGSIKLWTSDAWGPENSQQFTDPYSFTHITHGVLLYFLLQLVARRFPLAARAVLAVALESGWEVFENSDMVINRYRAATMALGYYGDSVCNSVGDILSCAVGFALAARLPARVTVLMVVLLEGALTVWIRDSLLLNIVTQVPALNWTTGA